jgi:hypothetical protein
MVVSAIVLIGIGVLFGFFFPVMFVAAFAGLVLLVVALLAAARRAKTATEQPSGPN